MYEAAAYQVFQATACWVALDWAAEQGYCLNKYIKELPMDDINDPIEDKTEKPEKPDNDSPFTGSADEEQTPKPEVVDIEGGFVEE